MKEYVPVTITLEKDALELIDQGAKKDQRNRSNFLQVAGVERAKNFKVQENAD